MNLCCNKIIISSPRLKKSSLWKLNMNLKFKNLKWGILKAKIHICSKKSKVKIFLIITFLAYKRNGT